jgi:hypothetical protein
MGGRPEGFEWQELPDGSIRITHHRKPATTLRGGRAAEFVADVESDDPQELMARLTGNDKRGNERMAKNHPRNRGR